jgi:hypothetical protein
MYVSGLWGKWKWKRKRKRKRAGKGKRRRCMLVNGTKTHVWSERRQGEANPTTFTIHGAPCHVPFFLCVFVCAQLFSFSRLANQPLHKNIAYWGMVACKHGIVLGNKQERPKQTTLLWSALHQGKRTINGVRQTFSVLFFFALLCCSTTTIKSEQNRLHRQRRLLRQGPLLRIIGLVLRSPCLVRIIMLGMLVCIPRSFARCLIEPIHARDRVRRLEPVLRQ